MIDRSPKQRIPFDIERCRYETGFQQAPFKQLIGRQAINGSFKLHPEIKEVFNAHRINRFVDRAGIVYLTPHEVRKVRDRDELTGNMLLDDVSDFAANRTPLLNVIRGSIVKTPATARQAGNTAMELSALIVGGDISTLKEEKLQIASRYDSYVTLEPTLYLGHLEGPVDEATLDVVVQALDATSSVDMRVGKIALH